MVLNMHGYTSSASQQETYTQMDVVADTGKFIVVYPDGVNNAWNGGFGVNANIDDVGFLSMVIDTMKKKFSVDSTKVFACGLSAGGFMSYRLACELQNKIAAIVPVSGLMSDSTRIFCQTLCTIPVMHFHGTADGVVNYNGNAGYVSVDSTMKIWIGKDGAPQTPTITNIPDINTSDNCTVTKYVYSPGQNNSEVVLFKITNGGHTWPGAIAVPSLGNTNEDMNASGEIWNFFRKFSLKCGVSGVDENNFSAEIKIFPNPTFGEFIVSGLRFPVLAEVYNVYGKKVFSKTINIKQETLNLSEASGIYFLKLTADKEISVYKILKQ